MKVKVIILDGGTKEDIQKAIDTATLQLGAYKHQEEKMLADLGRAGKEIAALARKVGQLQEDNQKLISQRIALLQIINQEVGLTI